MSRLITGVCKIKSLQVVKDVAARLNWSTEYQDMRHMRVNVPRETGAYYRPYIDIEIKEGGIATLTYDHVMGLGMNEASQSQDDMDSVTRTVIGQFKQAAFQVQLEALLQDHGVGWESYARADSAQVVTVRR